MSCLLFEKRFGFLVTLTFSDEHDQAKPRINRSKSSKFFRYLWCYQWCVQVWKMNCQTTEKGKDTSNFKFFKPSFYNVFVHFLADIWPRIESVLLITLENEKVQE